MVSYAVTNNGFRSQAIRVRGGHCTIRPNKTETLTPDPVLDDEDIERLTALDLVFEQVLSAEELADEYAAKAKADEEAVAKANAEQDAADAAAAKVKAEEEAAAKAKAEQDAADKKAAEEAAAKAKAEQDAADKKAADEAAAKKAADEAKQLDLSGQSKA